MKLGDLKIEDNWSYLLSFLPHNLEILSSLDNFLVRRRNIKSVEGFLRMCLTYALTDLSMQSTCVWAQGISLIDLSQPAFFKRFCGASDFLSQLLKQMLNKSDSSNFVGPNALNIKLIDASCIQGPGSVGTEWRLHSEIRVDSTGSRWRIENLHLTDEKVGETFHHFSFCSNDLVFGDRAYCTAKSIYNVIKQSANVLVRLNPNSIRLCNTERQTINLKSHEKEVLSFGSTSFDLLVPVPSVKKKKWKLSDAVDWLKVRVIGCRNNKGEVVWILTTVPSSILDDATVVNIYRIRWQIELKFKQLKSLAWLGKLPSPHKGPSAKSWIYARLIGSVLVEMVNEHANLYFSPEKDEDYKENSKVNPKQVSLWREFNIALWIVRNIILGNCMNFFFSQSVREVTLSSRRKRRNHKCPIFPTIPNNPP